MKPLLDVLGFEPHEWQSVERTRRFYETALGSVFELRRVETLTRDEPLPVAALNFFSAAGWTFERHPGYPLAFAMHGGPIVHRQLLEERLGMLRSNDLLLANCSSDIRLLHSMMAGPSPVLCHLPLPVDTDVFQPGSAASARQLMGASHFDFVIGFVGRFVPHKNLHLFLALVAELNEKLAPRTVGGLMIGKFYPDYPLLHFGVDYEKLIRQQIRSLGLTDKLICFASNFAEPELAICYQAMDLLYHPTNSIDENFGYVPVEAQACGIPVVGAAYGGLKDTIYPGTTGMLLDTWLTPNGIRMDLMDVAGTMESLLLDVELRHQMSEAARKNAVARYGIARCAEVLTSSLLGAVQQPREQSRQCRVIPSAVEEIATDLPPCDPPWDTFYRGISFYVSGPPPSVTTTSRVVARCHDPAWPVRAEMTVVEQGILEYCRRPALASALMDIYECSLADLDRLVERGLLSCEVRPATS